MSEVKAMDKFSVPKITYSRKGEEQGWIYDSTNPPTYDEMLGKIAGMSYESPIDIVVGEVQFKFEQDVMKAIQSYGICVDRDELIKALQYDRHQYEKGFADACKLNTKGERKSVEEQSEGEWIVDAWDGEEWVIVPYIKTQHTDPFCSVCYGCALHNDKGEEIASAFCPHCGAKMKGGEEE